MSDYRILVGDVRDRLKDLPDESVQCVVTSPPYWGLRDYGDDDQLGLEPTPEQYVEKMVQVFREVRRVLRKDGTLWLNLGDSYASKGVSGMKLGAHKRGCSCSYCTMPSIGLKTTVPKGLKPKDLVGIPWRVAFALQADGWWLRSDIIWAKPNPMPESVTDRPTKAHEYVFLLTKSARYYYDIEAVREQPKPWNNGQMKAPKSGPDIPRVRAPDQNVKQYDEIKGANRRDVWTITTKPFPGAHFAVFPPELPTLCIKAGTSEQGCCSECGAPVERVVERTIPTDAGRSGDAQYVKNIEVVRGRQHDAHRRLGQSYQDQLDANPPRTTGWQPSCACTAKRAPCMVLDPFAGAGTTGVVASKLGRDFIGIELNPEYAEMARKRVHDAPLSLFGVAAPDTDTL